MVTIAYINWWSLKNKDPQDRWFTHFIKANIGDDIKEVSYANNPDILISSCFEGMKGLHHVKNNKAKIKIFFSGENLNRYPPYDDNNILQNTFDLILTFKYNDLQNRMVRFPFWLMYYPFYNIDSDNNIIDYLEKSHKKNIRMKKSIFGTLLARHDRSGHRTVFLKELEKYGKVLCPSKYNKNCPNIGYGNKNKINFISKSKYIICPENSEYQGYYTEKLFEAFESGSVPIYWAISQPEADLLCKHKYCFIKNKDDPVEVESKIKDVIKNYGTYTNGNIFLPNSKTIIHNYYETLKTQIIKLLMIKTNKKILITPNYIFDYINPHTFLTQEESLEITNGRIFEYDKECIEALQSNHRSSYRDIYERYHERYHENKSLFGSQQYNNECIIINKSYVNHEGFIITEDRIYSNSIRGDSFIHFNSNYIKEDSVVSVISTWNFQYQAFASLRNIPNDILSKSKIHVPLINNDIIEWFGFLNIPPSKLIVGDIYANTLYIPKLCTPGNPYYSHIKWLQNIVSKPNTENKYLILVKCKKISNYEVLKHILDVYCKTNNLSLYIHDIDHLPTLKHQHEIFKKAKIVFASNFTDGNNIIFMKPDSWYVELISNHNINVCYSRIAYFCNINYIGTTIKNAMVDVTKVQNILNYSII